MTVLLSFEEKTDDARACAESGHCPFKESATAPGFISRVHVNSAILYHI